MDAMSPKSLREGPGRGRRFVRKPHLFQDDVKSASLRLPVLCLLCPLSLLSSVLSSVVIFTPADLQRWTNAFFFLRFCRFWFGGTNQEVAEEPFRGGTLQFAGSQNQKRGPRRGRGGHGDFCAAVQPLFGLAEPSKSRIYPQSDTEPANLSRGITKSPEWTCFHGSQRSPRVSVSLDESGSC